jgi:hypothetical protein
LSPSTRHWSHNRLDSATGAETALAAISGDGFSDFAFAPAVHTAYVASHSFATFPATTQLFAINTLSLTATAGPILSIGTNGIAYDTSSNQLFAVTFNLTPSSPAKFVRVDPSTGNETQLGTYDFGAFLEPGIALDSGSHTVYATQDVFDPFTGPITHIASINDSKGSGTLGPSTGTTIVALLFMAPSITVDSIIVDVKNALTTGAINNAGVAASLVAELNQAEAARDRGQCSTAASIYQAFINDVTAQSTSRASGVRPHISAATASQLIGEAQFLIANCP